MLNSPTQELLVQRAHEQSCDPLYFDYLVKEPTAHEYSELSKEIVAMCGYEVRNPNFTRVFKVLNARLNLKLDDAEIEAFGLLYTRLAEAPRFGGDIHMPSIKAENPAAHSCHSLILAQEVFRRSGLLSEGAQTLEVAKMRAHVQLGLLGHDLGEILGELTSLAQRSNSVGLEERPDIEREIARIHLIEAFRQALGLGQSPSEFERFQYEHKCAAGIGLGGEVSHRDQDILEIIQNYNERLRREPLPLAITQRVSKFLSLYDMAELKPAASSSYEQFVGNAVKVIEHTQGTRHLLRFAALHPDDIRQNLLFPNSLPNREPGPWLTATTDGTIPLRLISSYRMIKGMQYMETEISALFSAAQGIPERMQLARALRDVAYTTIAEWLLVAREVVDLSASKNDSTLSEMMRILSATQSRATGLAMIQAYLQGHVQRDKSEAEKLRGACGGTSPSNRLLRIETRERLAQLYLRAAQQDFIPTSTTPLALLEKFPQELVGFDQSTNLSAASLKSPT